MKVKVELLTSEQVKDVEKWKRANLDFDRMKFLYDKGNKENAKIAESFRKEIKDIVAQK